MWGQYANESIDQTSTRWKSYVVAADTCCYVPRSRDATRALKDERMRKGWGRMSVRHLKDDIKHILRIGVGKTSLELH